MNIEEMHVWFRQYAQQMGMQNVRAILPEQIDLLINTSIIDVVNQTIVASVASTNDRVISDNSKLGQINSLRTLYKTINCNCINDDRNLEINVTNIYRGSGDYKITIVSQNNINESKTVNIVDRDSTKASLLNTFKLFDCVNSVASPLPELLLIVFKSIGISLITIEYLDGNKIAYKEELNINPPVFVFDSENYFNGKLTSNPDYVFPKYMFLVDFSINYVTCDNGYTGNSKQLQNITISSNKFVSNLYPVRLIDDAFLADTLNDFVLKNRLRSPILVTHNNIFELYIDRFIKKASASYLLSNNLMPYKFRISYIAQPAKVRYAEDVNGVNVNCDLPEHMHITVLKHAVDLYRDSLSNGLSTAQQQEQAQQRENARNNYRNDANQ